MSHKRNHRCALGALCVLGAIAAPSAQNGPALATIRDIRRTVLADGVRVTIEVDREVPFHDDRIDGPVRVFVDLAGTRPAAGILDQTLRFDGDGGLVHQIRIGRHPSNVTRVVLDAMDVSSYSVYPLYGPFRIVIDCVGANGTKAMATAAPAPAPATPRPAPPRPALSARSFKPTPSIRRPPMGYPLNARKIADAYATIPANLPPAVVADPPPPVVEPPPPGLAASTAPLEPPNRNVSGGFSMSRQLGLGVSRIVIDPGHGGHDPGAKGKGISEAEVVLDIALRLEKLLQKVGVEVILTRRTDDFVPLPERTAIANREGADLFLSIHANASPNAQARGIETYFLNFANNLSAAAVAARENAASGQAMGALPDLVKTIALNNKLDESRDFATHIQRAMTERLTPIRDLGVKQAPFVVLIGAAMPSVLAEISFVTNAQDVKLLKGAAYRQRIAEALFNAVRRYQSSLKNPTAVAHQ